VPGAEFNLIFADLATGKLNRRVPFGLLQENTHAFIPAKYRPAGITFKDPRNMHRDQILQALRHCYNRQQESGSESAFRFEHVGGPNRKRLLAKYPVPVGNVGGQEGQTGQTKSKGKQRVGAQEGQAGQTKNKGKQRAVDQLEGLLTISQRQSPSTPDPVSHIVDNRTRVPDLVNIDLGQAIKLKELGYEVNGPINGPNEGFPEYQVPRSWLKKLDSQSAPQVDPTPNAPSTHLYPRPRPIPKPSQPASTIVIPDHIIDPLLLHDTPLHQTDDSHQNIENNIQGASCPNTGHDHDPKPNTEPDPDPGPDNATSSSLLGKEGQVTKLPLKHPSTRSTRRKVMTDDDRAMLEAQELLGRGTRSRVRRRAGK
jgi:hypothetical protein